MQRKPKSKFKSWTPNPMGPEALVRPLLTWFRRNARDLPWRRTRDPYAIWISEIMLQQTQVKTVIPYWQHWMRTLPSVQSLARARPEKVLKLWEGLGYYTRAHNLQKAARMIIEQHGGRFPENFNEVLELPGIGRYTAGAICSIAFNQPTPILDSNVIRVLARLFGVDKTPREKKTNAKLWAFAESLVRTAGRRQRPSEQNCSRLNQALMELGAVICTPRHPKCPLCPVRKQCVAFREDRVAELPNLGERASSTERRFVAFVAENHGLFLVRQRPSGVVNAHLWEFPNVEVTDRQPNVQQLVRELFGTSPFVTRPLRRIRHTITRYRITLEVFRIEFANEVPNARPSSRWYSKSQLEKFAFPSAHRRILEMLEA